MLANFAIFGNFHMNLALEGAVTGRLNVELSAELLLLLRETLPFVIDFQVLVVAFQSSLNWGAAFFLVTSSTHNLFFVAHDSQALLHLLDFLLAGRPSTKSIVLLIVVSLTLKFEFLSFNVLFDLVHRCQPFGPEVLHLLVSLAQ